MKSHQIPIVSFKTPMKSHQIPIVSFKTPMKSHQIPIVSFKTPMKSHQIPIDSFKTPMESHQIPIVSFKTPMRSHQIPIVSFKTPMKSHQIPIVSFKTHMKSHQIPTRMNSPCFFRTLPAVPPSIRAPRHADGPDLGCLSGTNSVTPRGSQPRRFLWWENDGNMVITIIMVLLYNGDIWWHMVNI